MAKITKPFLYQKDQFHLVALFLLADCKFIYPHLSFLEPKIHSRQQKLANCNRTSMITKGTSNLARFQTVSTLLKKRPCTRAIKGT